MELALTALIWGITIIVYVVAGFAIMTITISIGFAIYLLALAAQEWWDERKYNESVRKTRKRIKEMGE